MLINAMMVNYFQKQPLEVFCKKGVLKSLAIFTGKHVLKALVNKVAGLCKKRDSNTGVFL